MISRDNRSRLKEGQNPASSRRWNAGRNQGHNRKWKGRNPSHSNATSKEEAMKGVEVVREKPVEETMGEVMEEKDDSKRMRP